MAGDGSGGESPLGPEQLQESFRNRHQKEADRLRGEIGELVRQAKVLLHGQDVRSRPPPPRPTGKRAERESQLEAAIEKTNWYRNEIKRLRRDLESWDRVCGGPAHGPGAQERDPMEAYNLLVERRKELQRVQRNGHGLDRVAAAQRRAEQEQNALSPEVAERLRRSKDEVEQQKRLNVRLQAERQKVTTAKKQAEQDVRAANSELRSKAAELRSDRPPRPGKHPPKAHAGAQQPDGQTPKALQQLRRDVDILSEAVRQDERKHKVSQRDDEQQLDFTRRHVAKLQGDVAGHEAAIAQLRAQLRGEEPPLPAPGGSPRGALGPCCEGAAEEGPSGGASPAAVAVGELAAENCKDEYAEYTARPLVAGPEAEPEPEASAMESPASAVESEPVSATLAAWQDEPPQEDLASDGEADDMAALVAPAAERNAAVASPSESSESAPVASPVLSAAA